MSRQTLRPTGQMLCHTYRYLHILTTCHIIGAAWLWRTCREAWNVKFLRRVGRGVGAGAVAKMDGVSCLQLTGADLSSFSADKATAFSEAVYGALGNQTIYSVNVSGFTTVETVRQTRCIRLL